MSAPSGLVDADVVDPPPMLMPPMPPMPEPDDDIGMPLMVVPEAVGIWAPPALSWARTSSGVCPVPSIQSSSIKVTPCCHGWVASVTINAPYRPRSSWVPVCGW